ncbi:hypothetical protein GCM10028857_05380 [Salinarchaeum chitinilyticum]
MSVDAGNALSEAVDRITTQAALLVIGLYAVASIVQTAALQDLIRLAIEELRELVREEQSAEDYQEFVDQTDPLLNDLPLALGLDLVPALLLLFAALIGATVVTALAIDAFAREASSVGDLDTSRLVWNTINLLVGGIFFVIMLLIGFSFFFVPGLVVFFLFLFFPIAVVVEEENFFSAFGSSIDTVTDNFLQTLLLVLLLIVVGLVMGAISAVVSFVLTGAAGGIVSATLSAVGSMFTLAMLTRAYVGASNEVAADDPDGDFGDAEAWN